MSSEGERGKVCDRSANFLVDPVPLTNWAVMSNRDRACDCRSSDVKLQAAF